MRIFRGVEPERLSSIGALQIRIALFIFILFIFFFLGGVVLVYL